MLGVTMGAGLVIAAAGATPDRSEVSEQRPGPYEKAKPNSELIALSTVVNDTHQQLLVVDPKLRVVSVYHVDLASGNVELRCVRNIHWDLQMEYFNGNGLLPAEIRSMLGARLDAAQRRTPYRGPN